MATQTQINEVRTNLKKYKSKYLRKEFSHLDESATRIMTNSLLTDVLGYKELEEIRTEFRIRGEYADYVIQVGRKKHFVVEVKSIQIDLDEKHLRQSLNYAANEGIDWILLLNGRQIEVYKVNYGKPIASKLVFSLDLLDKDDFKSAAELLVYLTKRCVLKAELADFWKRISVLSPPSIAKMLFSEDIARIIRNNIKRDTGIYFQIDDVGESIHKVITLPIDIGKPRFKKL
ncbi:MAG TPA: type I restriction enzyme HsdR N-terminal domain-containing protein [Candidatus Saccharimonadales bacterium]